MNLNFPLSFCGKFIDLVKEFPFFSANICKIFHETAITMWSFVMKIQSFSDAWESWKFSNKTHAHTHTHTHKVPWIDTLECGVWPTLKTKIFNIWNVCVWVWVCSFWNFYCFKITFLSMLSTIETIFVRKKATIG